MGRNRYKPKQLCREAVDYSGVSNGVDSVDRDSSRKVNSETDKDRLVLFLVLYLLFLVYPKNSSVWLCEWGK